MTQLHQTTRIPRPDISLAVSSQQYPKSPILKRSRCRELEVISQGLDVQGLDSLILDTQSTSMLLLRTFAALSPNALFGNAYNGALPVAPVANASVDSVSRSELQFATYP